MKYSSAVACLSCLVCLALLGGCARPGSALRDSVERTSRQRDPAKLVEIGEAFAEVGDSTRAAQYFSMAIESGGDETKIFPRLLEVCVRDRQYRAALFYSENYLRRHPDDTMLRFEIGNLQAGMGNVKEARIAYERALRSTPKSPELHYALAVLSRDGEGNLLAADSQFRTYLELAPHGEHAEEARGSLLESVQ